MSRSCARQWRASFSPQDAVVRGGDEVGKVSTLLPSPLSFIHPRIRGTTIFMGHMKNEVSIYRPFSPALFFLLDACRGENRRRSASQYFGILCSECSWIVGRNEGFERFEEGRKFDFEFSRNTFEIRIPSRAWIRQGRKLAKYRAKELK